MVEVKGTVINAWMAFLKGRFGEAKLTSAIEKLDPESRSRLATMVLDSSWYPFELHSAMRTLTAGLRPDREKGFAVEMGRNMAHTFYTKVYTSLLVDEPLKQFQRAAWMDELLYRGWRTREIKVTGSSSCLVLYHYTAGLTPEPGHCASIRGYLIGEAEVSGGRNVKCSHPSCMLKGRPLCEFSVEWDAPASAS